MFVLRLELRASFSRWVVLTPPSTFCFEQRQDRDRDIVFVRVFYRCLDRCVARSTGQVSVLNLSKYRESYLVDANRNEFVDRGPPASQDVPWIVGVFYVILDKCGSDRSDTGIQPGFIRRRVSSE